jgi:hypothetical protein
VRRLDQVTMQTVQSASDARGPLVAGAPPLPAPSKPAAPGPAATNRARVEIERLMAELHGLVSTSESSGRRAVEDALPAAAKLQVVTANVDACNPSRRAGLPTELVALADLRVRSMRDAFERSLGYTSDATMRRLMGK